MTIAHRRLATSFLLVLILLAFALRLYHLESQSLWYDEGVTAMVAQSDLASLTRWTANDIQPPLYYYLVAGWGRLAGWSEWSLRFPAAFFGTVAVPLLAVVAIRLSRSRAAGLLAALIAACHPLLLYYSQEARMYTLLVTLGVLAAYCLLRSADASERSRAWRFWGGYTLAALLAAYTHYFAFFLLLALGVAYLLDRIVRSRLTGHTPRVLPFLLANTALLLFYLPWLRVLFVRLDIDTSYWTGTLKLWEALRAIAISFTSGESVLENVGTRLLWMYGAITLVALVGLLGPWRIDGSLAANPTPQPAIRSHRYRFAGYALLWLFVPIVAVLLLASFTPKFNARYVMVAWPGLVLLWSGGLAALLRAFVPLWQRLRVACNTQPRALPALSGLLGTGLLLSGFVYADVNWFTDPAFTKDQWRELAHYVRSQRRSNEAVVLVSGHAWPVWHYYAGDIPPIRLPRLAILDVNAVLDFANTAEPLRRGLAGKDGVWLVGWQDDVVDPMGVVPLQLARAGAAQPVNAQFWGLDLHHFTGLQPARISDEPPIQSYDHVNYDNRVELIGHTVQENGDLLLFWRARSQPLPDLYVTGYTLTASGIHYADLHDRRPAAYAYPTFRWRPQQVTVGRVPARAWAGEGAMPGNYQLHLGVYDPAGDPAGLDIVGEAGTPQGKEALLALLLSAPTPAVLEENPLSWAEVAPGLFLDLTVTPAAAEPAQPVIVEASWFAQRQPQRAYQFTWQWRRQEDGEIVARTELPPAFPTDGWPTQQLLRQVFRVRPLRYFPPGEYWVEMGVAGSDQPPLRRPFTVLPSTRNFTAPPLAVPINADFHELSAPNDSQSWAVIRLLGLQESVPPKMTPGQSLTLWPVWQSVWYTTDYQVTVQFLDEDGRPRSQVDQPLLRGSSTWLPEEVIQQSLMLEAPAEPGTYRLILAIYDPSRPGLPRLPLASGGDFVELAKVKVVAD